MNILISTTEGHNNGDRIILLGVKRLLEARYSNIQYFEYNRNPDLQTYGAERELRSNLVGNYYISPDVLRYMDMVVLAGSPEWCGGPMKALYEGIEKYVPKIPLQAIGIGRGHEYVTLSDLDKRILSRPETKIITRSFETSNLLIQDKIHSVSMVCPAMYAFIQVHLNQEGTLLILQKPGHGWHEINRNVLPEFLDHLAPHKILCLHMKEFEYFSSHGLKPLYAADPASFASIVSDYSKVISTRLHGAIGALSLGVPAIVVSDGDYRIETCARMFGDMFPISNSVKEALSVKPGYISYATKQFLFEQYLAELAT